LPEIATKPGVERWPVKTEQDPDRVNVGKNVLAGEDLGRGIVVGTIEELIAAPRHTDTPNPNLLYNTYQSRRAEPVDWFNIFLTAVEKKPSGTQVRSALISNRCRSRAV